MVPEAAFRTVFDASQSDGSWVSWAGGVLFVGAGILMMFRPALMRPWLPNWFRQGRPGIFFSWAFLVLSVGWTVGAFVEAHNRYRKVSDVLEGDRAQIVEGFITNFVPMPASGHSPTGSARGKLHSGRR